MSRKPSSSDTSTPPHRKLDVQRIRVNADGTDRSGAYWGRGADVFIVSAPDGSEEVTVRAANAGEARRLATVELDRKPVWGARPVARPTIGGHPPRKSRFEMDWHNAITGETARLRITHSRDYLTLGSDHIEIESIAPKRAALPVTETGYRSHFIKADELAHQGGAKSFVASWLDSAAKTKDWQPSQKASAQGDLFQWAKAQDEVGTRNTKSKRPAGNPRPATKRDRTPP